MNKHNTRLVCSAAALLVAGSFVGSVSATPMGGSNLGLEHGIGTMDAKKWSLGIYTVQRERHVDMGAFGVRNMLNEKTLAYLGYDWSLYGWSRWFTTYICAGSTKTRLDGRYGTGELEWGAGVNFNFLDQQINDPTLFEDRLRIRGGIQYTVASADVEQGYTSMDWSELFGHATISLVNDIRGNKLFLPNSIALYVGPIFSMVGSSSSFDDDMMFGYTAGMEVYYTESISLDVGLEDMDFTHYTAGIHIRF